MSELPSSMSVASAHPAELPARPKHAAEFSVRTMSTLVRYLVERHGESLARDILRQGDLTLEAASATSGWVSVAQVEAVFAAARHLVGSDEAFIEATAYRARDAFGPIAYLTWATRIGAVMDLAFRSLEFFSKVSSGGPVARGPGRMVARYTSKVRESRLMCLSRHGNSRALPTIWGMPPARVRDIHCIAWGDDCCEYEITWDEPLTHSGAMGGALLAFLLCSGLAYFHVSWLVWWWVPLLGTLAGHVVDLRQRRAAEVRENGEVRAALTTLGREADNARTEFLALNQRQRDVAAELERVYDERLTALEEAQRDADERDAKNRGEMQKVSHDIKNPLTNALCNVEYVIAEREERKEVSLDVLHEARDAIDRGARLLTHLNDLVVRADQKAHRRIVESIPLDELIQRIDRRARAFAHGTQLKVSVFSSKGAPADAEVDTIAFDRVLDNLLSNAVKYTARGSLVVEVGGGKRTLLLTVSDTGRGIAADLVRRAFQPGGSEPSERAPGSRGVGLSSVLKVVADLGGQVEVMTRVGEGTTMRVTLPCEAGALPKEPDAALLIRSRLD